MKNTREHDKKWIETLQERNRVLNELLQLTQIENEELKEQLTLTDVSQQSKLLPDFLYEDDGIIRTGIHGDSAVTDEWNDYLKKTGNCDCDNHIACIVCGEEKGLDGDFWERKDRE